MIQPNNQQSVIQTATNLQPVAISKGNVILVKPNSVIQTAQGNLQTLQVNVEPINLYTLPVLCRFSSKKFFCIIQVVETTGSDDSYSDDDSPKKVRDMLSRRDSFKKILNEINGSEIAGKQNVSF